MPFLAGAEPFAADGGPVGVVLSHGFTAVPASVRPWAEHLAAAGLTVRLPLLPGHGTRWQDANRTRWQDWYAVIERAYAEVAARCDTVFAGGLSMGGTLVTRLAEQKGARIAGLVLVNPIFGLDRFDVRFAPLLAKVVKSRPAIAGDIKKPDVREPGYDRMPLVAFASMMQLWKATLADLTAVTAPIKLYRSTQDHVVDPLSARLLKAGATSTTVDEVLLEDSYHVATLDYDAPRIFEGSLDFIRALAPEAAEGRP